MVDPKEKYLLVIRDWKHYWLSQEDNYVKRALGVDANMVHDLARRLANFEEERNEKESSVERSI